MTIVMLGIDLGKNVCSLAGLDEDGRVVLSKRLKREGVVPFIATLPVCGSVYCTTLSALACPPSGARAEW